MCGIAGIISNSPISNAQKQVATMAQSLAHRGPNSQGTFVNIASNVAFGHSRLTILDAHKTANQPLTYCNRYTITYNGEVYNYVELRETLKKHGYTFTTTTDTEVVVAAYEHYGNNCVQHFDGMFALAIYDSKENTVYIARDRFGEKPIYYHYHNHTITFASELKALWVAGVAKVPNYTMHCLYLGLGYTNMPLEPQVTFYQQVYSVLAAHYIVIKVNALALDVVQTNYYDVDKETQQKNTLEKDVVETVNTLLIKSIKQRLRADCAIGTSLSGGLDSSGIACYLNALGIKNYHTFSATHNDYINDESKYIATVTQQYNLPNHQVQPTASSLLHDWDAFVHTQEQPVISSSVYAQYKVMQLAKQHGITVLLDGQGADETQGGYTKYIHWYLQELFLYNKKLYKHEVAAFYKNNKTHFGIANKMASWFPASAAYQLQKKATTQLLYKSYLQPTYTQQYFSKLCIYKPVVKKLNDILYHNTMQFGMQELLRYADKNAMAHGVEVRMPYLQHELVQYLYSLPSNLKLKNGYQKNILRQCLHNHKLDASITWRTNKIGYETPEQQWLQHPIMHQKIHQAKQLLVQQGILQPKILTLQLPVANNWRIIMSASYLN